MTNRLIFLSVVLAFSLIFVQAQNTAPREVPVLKNWTVVGNSEEFVVGDVKGRINNKAITLIKPVYPPEAQQAGAEGAVRVQITIGEEGTVLTADMISGNPLLRAATENAVMRSKFRIARDAGGNPIRTEGVLVYTFVIEKANWIKIAHSLSLLDSFPVQTLQIPSVRKAFAPEWTSELAMLEKLEEIRQTEPPMPNSPFADAPELVRSGSFGNATSASTTLVRRLDTYTPPTAERISLSQNLLLALPSRLENDEVSLWEFNLGLDLRRAMETDSNNRSEASQIIRQNIEKAPAKTSKETLTALNNLARIFDRPNQTMDTFKGIRKTLSIILSGK